MVIDVNTLASAFAAVTLFLPTLVWGQGQVPANSSNGWAVIHGVDKAQVAMSVLTALYGQDTNKAVQVLEINLDNAVCHLAWAMRQEQNAGRKSLIHGTLASIAEFRKHHDRPVITFYASEEERRVLKDQASRAEEILRNAEAACSKRKLGKEHGDTP
jgi:hypothetical protein